MQAMILNHSHTRSDDLEHGCVDPRAASAKVAQPAKRTERVCLLARRKWRRSRRDLRTPLHCLLRSIGLKWPCSTKAAPPLSLIHISEPTRLGMISYAV